MLVNLYVTGRLGLDFLVSESIALSDVERAFARMEAGGFL